MTDATTSQPDALFELSDDMFTPSLLTTGPWQADAMHGGPPSALVGRMVESVADGWFVARLNVELERPVPLLPLSAEIHRRDVSRRVAHVDVHLRANDAVVVSARALLLATSPLPEPSWWSPSHHNDVLDESHRVEPPAWASGVVPTTYHQHAVEHRMAGGDAFGTPGPASSWVNLRYPLVRGEVTSGLCRVLAAADFGSGISAVFGDEDGAGLINADLSVALTRRPTEDWVRIDSETTLDASGTALAVTHLADRHGPLGIATQSLLGLRL